MSAYKSMTRPDESSSEDFGDGAFSEDSSSNTIRGDSSSDSNSEPDATPSMRNALPLELKNRVLLLTSRGVSYRHRHLLADLNSILPHSYKDTKLDTKSSNNYNSALNGLADLHSCNYIAFLEARKHGQDLYLWLACAPNGPTIKFSVSNVHTMAELGFGGNCLKGGRGIVVFDKSFEDGIDAGTECKSLLREMLRAVFCVPSKGVRGMKPFVDRIVGIYGLDGKIWIRVYEIREAEKEPKEGHKTSTEVSLVEIGPRLVLTPVVILEGSFGGPVIFENREFVSPNQIRSDARIQRAGKYARRKGEADERLVKKKSLGLERGSRLRRSNLDNEVLFG